MNSLKVYMDNMLVGTLYKNPNNLNYYSFKYDDDFINRGKELCPILMLNSSDVYTFNNLSLDTFKGLPPLIVDSIPDKYGSILLEEWRKSVNKNEIDVLDILSYIGKRGMGALEFVPEYANNELFEVEIDKLLNIANEVLNNRNKVFALEEKATLQQLIDVGSSIGGARAKAVIAINQNGIIKSGQIAGLKGYKYYIMKFDDVKSSEKADSNSSYYTRIEYAYYLMAIGSGINMMESSLYEKDGLYHFLTKRYDRDEDGNKIHVLSLAGMAGFDYKHAGENSYEEVASILKGINADFNDIIQLFKRMVFNVVFKNNDDHVKNISFIMDSKGNWSLSPAYDLTYAYNPEGQWTRYHQMRINNKVDNITYDDLIESAKNMGIKLSVAKEEIKKIVEVSNNFKEYAIKAKLPDEVIEFINEKIIRLNKFDK